MGDCQLSIGAGDPVHSAVWSLSPVLRVLKSILSNFGMNEGCSIKFGLSKNFDPEALLMTFIIL